MCKLQFVYNLVDPGGKKSQKCLLLNMSMWITSQKRWQFDVCK